MCPEQKLLLDEMHRLFNESDRKWDSCFAESDRKWDARFGDSEKRLEQRFIEIEELRGDRRLPHPTIRRIRSQLGTVDHGFGASSVGHHRRGREASRHAHRHHHQGYRLAGVLALGVGRRGG